MKPLPTPMLTCEDAAIWNGLWGGCPKWGGPQRYWSALAEGSINADRRDAELMLCDTLARTDPVAASARRLRLHPPRPGTEWDL